MDPRRLSTSGTSLYLVLGLENTATPDEIKKTYRRLALQLHPDKTNGDPVAEEKFKEVNRANQVLSDSRKKTIYDRYGSFGLYLAEQFGEENVHSYFVLTSPWVKAGVIILGIISGCYCCCCCFCCCFNFCCGKCKPELPNEADYQNLQEEGVAENQTPNEPIVSQPTPTESSPLKSDNKPSYSDGDAATHSPTTSK